MIQLSKQCLFRKMKNLFSCRLHFELIHNYERLKEVLRSELCDREHLSLDDSKDNNFILPPSPSQECPLCGVKKRGRRQSKYEAKKRKGTVFHVVALQVQRKGETGDQRSGLLLSFTFSSLFDENRRIRQKYPIWSRPFPLQRRHSQPQREWAYLLRLDSSTMDGKAEDLCRKILGKVMMIHARHIHCFNISVAFDHEKKLLQSGLLLQELGDGTRVGFIQKIRSLIVELQCSYGCTKQLSQHNRQRLIHALGFLYGTQQTQHGNKSTYQSQTPLEENMNASNLAHILRGLLFNDYSLSRFNTTD